MVDEGTRIVHPIFMKRHRTFPIISKLGGWKPVLALLERHGETVSPSRKNHWFRRGIPGEIKTILVCEAAAKGISPSPDDFDLIDDSAHNVHGGDIQAPTDDFTKPSSPKSEGAELNSRSTGEAAA